jgi:hypothetical protein
MVLHGASSRSFEQYYNAENIVMEVLNQAFDLNLTENECFGSTQKILNELNKRRNQRTENLKIEEGLNKRTEQ